MALLPSLDAEHLSYLTHYQVKSFQVSYMNVPTYDIPASPILLLGFAGIVVALFTLYTVNKAYYNSPFKS